MTKRSRESFCGFKAKVALAAIKAEETLAQWPRGSMFIRSDRSMEEPVAGASGDAFNGSGQAAEAGPDIGTCMRNWTTALENDFLVGALRRSAGSSAKR